MQNMIQAVWGRAVQTSSQVMSTLLVHLEGKDLSQSASHSVVPERAASASPGNLFKMHIFSPTTDLLDQKP